MNEREIFAEALQQPTAAERAAFLARSCGADAALRQRIEELIIEQDQLGSFLEMPPKGAIVVPPEATLAYDSVEHLGSQIGPYKLLQVIGEGGMGAVYLAEQTAPVVRRVALKIIKPGMDTRQVIARFEAERQALALMDHPHIAKVLDAGATASGRPYFVMELVKGVPVTQYCDQQHLTPRERLQLFLPVCQAIQHAHQKGIIHRDLKPSNVLIALYDGRPVAKVIDFGVAKATGQRLTEKTMYTEFGQIVGTLEYMSPEQAELSQLDIDTRSDIYSLGVMLYELLTGTTPFEKKRVQSAAFHEILRMIREDEPPRPSTRLSDLSRVGSAHQRVTNVPPSSGGHSPPCSSLASIAALRHTEPAKLTKLVRGELDWIVMKALDKDRSRRYETADSLAHDIERYLADEPVLACPPSRAYCLRKFARRHRSALTMVTILAAALVTAGSVVAVSFIRTSLALHREAAANKKLENSLYFQAIQLAEQARTAGQVRLAEQFLLDCEPPLRGWEWHYLRRLRFGQRPALTHSSHLFCMAVSRDGRHIAVGGSDGTVAIRGGPAMNVVHLLQAHDSWARSVAFSPDGKRLVSGGWDRRVCVWNVNDGQPVWSAQAVDIVQCVAFHPNGRLIASSGASGRIQFWDAHTGAPAKAVVNHDDNVFALAFSPDGELLAAGGSDRRVKIWRTEGSDLVHHLPAQAEQILGLAFSPDGRMLAAASGGFYIKEQRGELCIWEASSGRLQRRFGGADGSTFCVAFSPDGRRVAAGGSADPSIKVWDLATGLQAIGLRGHTEAIWSVAFSPTGNQLYSASGDHTLRIWDGTPLSSPTGMERRVLAGFDAEVHGIAFHPDSKRLATASPEGALQVWDALSGEMIRSIRVAGASCVAFSNDGKWLAAGSFGVIRVWDVPGWQLRHEFPTGDVVRGLSFDPAGGQLAAATGKTVGIWDLVTGNQRAALSEHTNFLLSAVYSPNGLLLASAGFEGEVKVWNLETTPASTPPSGPPSGSPSGPPLNLPGHVGRVSCTAFSPDGRALISAGVDGVFHLWDTATWERMTPAIGHAGHVHALAYSPDGAHLASAGSDATIRVWDAANFRPVYALRGHTNSIGGIAYSPDGRLIASVSLDKTVRIWDAHPPPDSPAVTAVDPGR